VGRNKLISDGLDLSSLGGLDFGDHLPVHEASSEVKVANNATDIAKLLRYTELLRDAEKFNGFRKWFVPGSPYGIDALPKHRTFLFSGSDYRQRYFSAANRVGKTICGAFETTLHCTGLYPDWWEGKRFDHPVDWWVAGKSSETTRDIIQKELLGAPGSFGTGMLPRDTIIDANGRPMTRARSGVAGAVGLIMVKHASGGTSTIGFKSYDQGREGFEGTARHGIWLDELPPIDVYSECFLRCMSTRGIIFITATAKQGLTPLVLNYYNTADWLPPGQELPTIVKLVREQAEMGISKSGEWSDDKPTVEEFEKSKKAVIVAGWNDAPWLSEEDKKEQMAEIPAHQVEAATTGLPGAGGGAIFTIPLQEMVIKDFPIPSHWKHIIGMDVGWNNTGAVRVVENPETGQCYVIAEHKRGEVEPIVHASKIKAWGDWIPVEIDPASKGRNQNDGKQLFNLYRKEGLRLIEANNAVEAGITKLFQMFSAGTLKIFSSCIELQKEVVTYNRNAETGKVVKKNDHLIDALRYSVMGLHHARVRPANYGKKKGGIHSGAKYDI
jgi:phage terminase large subunit-like protein